MASLWWSAQEYEVSPAAENIGDVMQAVAAGLQNHGYKGVAVAGDVHCYMPGIDFFAGIMFLHISGEKYWQVIAIGGDGTEAQAQAEFASIKTIISSLPFL